MTISKMWKKIPELLRNRDGNFAMMASLVLPVIFVAGSLVLDTTNALSMKTSLQNAADSAALANAQTTQPIAYHQKPKGRLPYARNSSTNMCRTEAKGRSR